MRNKIRNTMNKCMAEGGSVAGVQGLRQSIQQIGAWKGKAVYLACKE